MGHTFYLSWLSVVFAVVPVGWWLTRRIAARRRLVVRTLIAAVAITPFPLWVPGEGGFILPAAMLFLTRDHHLAWWGRAAVAIGIITVVLTAIGHGISRAARLIHKAR